MAACVGARRMYPVADAATRSWAVGVGVLDDENGKEA
jgi:hypothetical protein